MGPQRGENFSGKKFNGEDFSKRKLAYADFSQCSLIDCKFNDSDCKYANFTGANCYASDFTGTSLYRANMTNACLEKTIFKPRDVFGLTVTLKCETFQNMEVDEDWLECWLMLAAIMKLPKPRKQEGIPEKKPWLDRFILLLGEERYVRLKAVFNRRII
jgi:uncharacterized protein YjbI with pentapeptide repeats